MINFFANIRIAVFATMLMALASQVFAAEPIETSRLQGLGDTRFHSLKSGLLGRSLNIFVRLPEEYAGGNDQEAASTRFPTIYLLDGGITFPLLAAYYHYLHMGGEAPAMIIVGISYGKDSFEEGNFRSTDFTAPTAERAFWGGASLFQQVLATELLPLIEQRYRSAADRRVIFGQSLGGQFVLYTSLTRPQLFWGHIASNPALHRNLPFFLEWRGEAEVPAPSSRLFVSSAEFDDPRFREPARQWIAHWSAQDNKPWFLETRTLNRQTHMSAAPAAFRQGIAWLFSGAQPSHTFNER